MHNCLLLGAMSAKHLSQNGYGRKKIPHPLAGWLPGCLVGWLFGELAVGWLANWLAGD